MSGAVLEANALCKGNTSLRWGNGERLGNTLLFALTMEAVLPWDAPGLFLPLRLLADKSVLHVVLDDQSL